MRTFNILVLALALGACGGKEGGANSLQEAEAQARADSAESGQIECAVGGAKGFTRTCTVDRAIEKAELMLTIRHDDGGFRRFRVLKDGRGVVTADGAEPAMVSTIGSNAIEVQVGQDRYRLPATVKGKAAPAK